jgi:hypothetical protein
MATKQQWIEATRRRKLRLAVCRKCKEEKSWDDFNPCPRRRPFGLTSFCKLCDLLRKSEQKRRHRNALDIENRRLADRRSHLKKFGLTVEEYDRLLEDQNGVCAICNNPESDPHPTTKRIQKNLAVDHCHETNTNRGLLCAKCNKGLGSFKDNIAYLERAIDYLRRHANP